MIWGKITSEKCETIYSVSKRFAWHPIQLTDGQWVWWEYVWKHSWASYLSSGYRYERCGKVKEL